MAWLWLRHQPGSALARWFHGRVGPRAKKVTIVALAIRQADHIAREMADAKCCLGSGHGSID